MLFVVQLFSFVGIRYSYTKITGVATELSRKTEGPHMASAAKCLFPNYKGSRRGEFS